MVFYAAFNSISVISRWQLTLFMSYLGFTSTRPGSEVTCPGTLPRKNPEDLVRREPRTPGLQVKHFTTGPRGTLCKHEYLHDCGICRRQCHFEFSTVFWKPWIVFCTKPKEVDPINLNVSTTNKCFDSTQIYNYEPNIEINWMSASIIGVLFFFF